MQKSIAVIGDSITAGNPGVSYAKYIRIGKIDNYGSGGETVTGLRKRIRRIKPHDYLIIEIGINDVLLPFLQSYSVSWKHTVSRIIRRGSIPISDKSKFSDEFEKLLSVLDRSNTILLTIPCCGEMLNNRLNLKISEYNRAVQCLCTKYGLNCIDINAIQRDKILEKNKPSEYFINKSIKMTFLDSILSKIGLSDYVSVKRGLATTIDGVHFNSAFAKKAAKLLEDVIMQL